jgi:hypothetical protein
VIGLLWNADRKQPDPAAEWPLESA